jgi:predicted permease
MKTPLQRLLALLPWICRRRERSLDEELASYLEMAEETAREQGLSTAEARRAARQDLGNLTITRELVRSEWIPPRLEYLAQDIRYLVRSLRREPVFAFIAIASMALGISAANAVFSLVDGILLKPLAYAHPNKLVYLQEFVPALSHLYPKLPVNYQHFCYWRSHSRSFESMAALRASGGTLTGSGEPVVLDSVETTTGLFQMLGTHIALGRGFLPEEELAGRRRVAIITHTLWRIRFRSDPEIIGKHIVFGGAPVEIVGVLPPDFTFPAGSDLGQLAGLGKRIQIFQPIQSPINEWDGDYDYITFARLRPGIALSHGLAELAVLTRHLSMAHKVESEPRPVGRPLQDVIGGSVRTSLWALFGSVLVLLLIVCVNLANLMLARSHSRMREFSIRTALGAARIRLVQQILTEALFFSTLGAAIGIALAAGLIRLLKTTSFELPRMAEVHIDARVILFSLALTILCGCISGLLPAYRAARSDLNDTIRSGSSAVTASHGSLRARQALVGCEVALSTALVFLAALMISSLLNLLHVDKGFEEKRAAAIDLDLPDVQYSDAPKRARLFEQVLAQVSALPGIRAAAIVQGLPLTGETMVNGIELEGPHGSWIDASGKAPILVNVRFVSPAYFQTLGIPLLKGRSIEPQDRTRKIAVLSERLASKIWPGQDPLGRKFKTGSQVGVAQVVGIVGDTYNGRLDEQPTLIVYAPFWVRPPGGASLVFRAAGIPQPLIHSVQRAVWSIDPSIPVSDVRTLTEIVSAATARRRFQMQLAGSFGLAALLLALIGIYGVVSYSVEQRKGELGLRLALGAEHFKLVPLMMRYGLNPVLVGLGFGLMFSVAIGGLARGLVFGVSTTDPATMLGVCLLLMSTAAVACLAPAIRVIRLDPVSVLRHD